MAACGHKHTSTHLQMLIWVFPTRFVTRQTCCAAALCDLVARLCRRHDASCLHGVGLAAGVAAAAGVGLAAHMHRGCLRVGDQLVAVARLGRPPRSQRVRHQQPVHLQGKWNVVYSAAIINVCPSQIHRNACCMTAISKPDAKHKTCGTAPACIAEEDTQNCAKCDSSFGSTSKSHLLIGPPAAVLDLLHAVPHR